MGHKRVILQLEEKEKKKRKGVFKLAMGGYMRRIKARRYLRREQQRQ